MSQGIHHSLIDDVMDAYIAWREESAAVESAYRRWATALSTDAACAHAAYVAALDREELASSDYEETLRRSTIEHARDSRRSSWLRDAA
jgi:agmatine/peptidylarginine deiminase